MKIFCTMRQYALFGVMKLLLIPAQPGFSQQLPLFTQYRENQGIINPSAPAADFLSNEDLRVFAGVFYRRQWVGQSFSPHTQTLRAEYLSKSRSFTLLAGGSLMNDQTGATGFTGFYGRLAGMRTFGRPSRSEGTLSVGISFGLVQYRVDGSKVTFHPQDNRFDGNIDFQQFFPDAGVGIFYFHRSKTSRRKDKLCFYGGFSIPQVLGLKLYYEEDRSRYPLERVRHYYALAGFQKPFGKGTEYQFWEPSVWLKYVPAAPLNVNVNLRAFLSKSFWLGGGISTSRALHFETGLRFFQGRRNNTSWFKIGYTYDYSFQPYRPDFGNTHEINLSMAFPGKR